MNLIVKLARVLKPSNPKHKRRSVSRLCWLIGLLVITCISAPFDCHTLLQVWLNYSQATLLRDGSPQPLSPTAEEKSEKTASSFDFLVTLFNTEVGCGDRIQQLLEQTPSRVFLLMAVLDLPK